MVIIVNGFHLMRRRAVAEAILVLTVERVTGEQRQASFGEFECIVILS
jgi:hypothetical protein